MTELCVSHAQVEANQKDFLHHVHRQLSSSQINLKSILLFYADPDYDC